MEGELVDECAEQFACDGFIGITVEHERRGLLADGFQYDVAGDANEAIARNLLGP